MRRERRGRVGQMKRPDDTEQDRQKVFGECMAQLAAAFRVDVPLAMKLAYWHALGGYDCDRIREGFDGALRNEEFWPTPARIRKYIHQIPEDLYPEVGK